MLQFSTFAPDAQKVVSEDEASRGRSFADRPIEVERTVVRLWRRG
jgi:hypothetical protein